MLHTKGRDGQMDGYTKRRREKARRKERLIGYIRVWRGGGRGREGERVKRCGRKREKEEGRGMLG